MKSKFIYTNILQDIKNRTYLRNDIPIDWSHEHDLPPKLLESLKILQQNIPQYYNGIDSKSLKIFQESTALNTQLGICFLRINPSSPFTRDKWIHDPFVAHQVLKRALQWAKGQKTAVSLDLIEYCRHLIINHQGQNSIFAEQGIALLPPKSRFGKNIWIFGRQPLKNNLLQHKAPLTNGMLWDGRFKIMMKIPSNDYQVRPLLFNDILHLESKLKNSKLYQKQSKYLNYTIRNIPHALRQTLPCIVDNLDEVVSVPSFGLNLGSNSFYSRFHALK